MSSDHRCLPSNAIKLLFNLSFGILSGNMGNPLRQGFHPLRFISAWRRTARSRSSSYLANSRCVPVSIPSKGDDIIGCQIHFSTSDKRWDVTVNVAASDDRLNRVVAFANRLDAVLTGKASPAAASGDRAEEEPHDGRDRRYPLGYTPPKAEEERLEAPYGRTPGGSALDPGVPGHPNPDFLEFVKPKHYSGIDPNDHDQSYLHYGIPEDAVKGTPFRDRGDDADTIDYFAPVTHDLLVGATQQRRGSLCSGKGAGRRTTV